VIIAMGQLLYLYFALGCMTLAARWRSLVHEEVPTVIEHTKDENALYPKAEEVATKVAVFLLPIYLVTIWPIHLCRRLTRGTWKTKKLRELEADKREDGR